MKIDLNDLTLENLDSWPIAIKFLVIGIVFVLIIAFGYWFDNKQQLATLSASERRELELKQIYQVKHQLAANYTAYKVQLAQIKQTFGEMLRQLPSSTEVPGLLEDISQAGVSCGLAFKLFKPLPEIKHEFYAELPIQIQVTGSYHQLAAFISKIVGLDRIVTLHDFTIGYEQTGANTAPIGNNLLMEITAKTYRYTEAKDEP